MKNSYLLTIQIILLLAISVTTMLSVNFVTPDTKHDKIRGMLLFGASVSVVAMIFLAYFAGGLIFTTTFSILTGIIALGFAGSAWAISYYEPHMTGYHVLSMGIFAMLTIVYMLSNNVMNFGDKYIGHDLDAVYQFRVLPRLVSATSYPEK